MTRIPSRYLAALLPLALAACASLEEEMQPVVDSLRTPDMEAAIKSAQPSTPEAPPPKQSM
jgi:hypothetical protein